MLTPASRLRPRALAVALTEHGYPIKETTLGKMRSIGGGPPYDLWGRFPIYTWGPALAWAKARCRPRGEPVPAEATSA